MTQTERTLIEEALAHLVKSKELHDFGDMKAYTEARKAREILAKLLEAAE